MARWQSVVISGNHLQGETILREMDDALGEGVNVKQVDVANVHAHRVARRIEHRLWERVVGRTG